MQGCLYQNAATAMPAGIPHWSLSVSLCVFGIRRMICMYLVGWRGRQCLPLERQISKSIHQPAEPAHEPCGVLQKLLKALSSRHNVRALLKAVPANGCGKRRPDDSPAFPYSQASSKPRHYQPQWGRLLVSFDVQACHGLQLGYSA